MIARITRILLLVQLVVAILLALAIRYRWPQVPAVLAALSGVGCVLLVRAAIVANNFRIAGRFPSDSPTVTTVATATSMVPALLRAYLDELRATLLSSSWHMPFCRLGASPAIHGRGLPVLFIHGYGCNSGYWRPLARALEAAGISYHGVDLEPVLCDIDGYLPQVGRAVDLLCRAAGATQVVIVAHSMGGLVARAWLREHGWQQVAGLITLGTPHRGTGLAKFGLGRNAQQMCRTGDDADAACNPWLAGLNAAPGQERGRVVSIYSSHDNIIAPPTSSFLAGAHNIAFAGIGHVALASEPLVIACVIDRIRHAGTATQDRAAAAQSISIQEKPSS